MSRISGTVFEPWLARWGLVADGKPIRTDCVEEVGVGALSVAA